MNELEVLASVSKEPIAIVLFLILIFKEPIKSGLSKMWCKITHRDRKKSAQELLEDFHSSLNYFRAELNEMKLLLAENEAYMNSISQGTLVQMLNDKGMTPKHRARAFLRLLALGINGRTQQNGIKFVLENYENKEAFLDAVEDIKFMNLKIKDEVYFNGVLEHINQRIYELACLPEVHNEHG